MFKCHSCGYMYEHGDGLSVNQAGSIDFYVFVNFLSDAEAYIDGQWLPAKGNYILYCPNTTRIYRSTSLPYVNDWIHFFAADNGGFFDKIGLKTNRLLQAKDGMSIGRSIKNIADALNSESKWRLDIASNELENLFFRLSHTGDAPGLNISHRRYLEGLEKIRDELYSNPKAEVSVKSLAAKIDLSPSYFQVLYKEAFGASVGEDIVKGRISRARYLLQNSLYTVGEIGRMSGYACEEHFLRQFKKHIGETPGNFRKNSVP